MHYHVAKTKKDFEYIASLFNPNNVTYFPTKKINVKTVEKLSKIRNRRDFIVTEGDDFIGWFNIRQSVDKKEGLFGIIVDKPYQGQGYGNAIMKMIEKEGRRLNIKNMKVQTYPENKRARQLYKKFGYKIEYKLLCLTKKL